VSGSDNRRRRIPVLSGFDKPVAWFFAPRRIGVGGAGWQRARPRSPDETDPLVRPRILHSSHAGHAVTTPRPAGARTRLARLLASLTLAGTALAGTLVVAPGAQAAPRVPNPTAATIAAATGPFATAQVAAQNVAGFGSATIYYPTDRSQGPYGVVAIAPGFFSWWFQLQWMGPRLASQGFVVVGMDTTTVFDWPALRGQELVAALNNAVADPRLAGIVDGSRRAMIGWSMGGGGTLDQAAANPANLKAAIALAPWELSNTYSTVQVPSLVVTGTADTVATQGGAYYNAIPGEKALVSLAGADHFFPTSANTAVAAAMISWLKRWVDGDTRYTQFLCPGPPNATGVAGYQNTCPF